MDDLSALYPDSDFRFEVLESRSHPEKRFTQYRLRVTIFPAALLQPTVQLLLWKRFSEAQALHKQLQKLCEQLHLKERPPPLPDAPLFSRFDSNVIGERKKAFVSLLEFAAKFPILAGSSFFADFLSNAERVTLEEDVKLQVPKMESPETSQTLKSIHFDPTANAYLADLMNLENEISNDSLLCVDQHENGQLTIKSDHLPHQLPPTSSLPDYSLSSSSSSSALPLSNTDEVHDAVKSDNEANQTFLVDAATLIAQAQSAESAGDYDVAFESYKCVIGILMDGVKEETNKEHAIAIKHKIHQYLQKAEHIFVNHLNSNSKTTKNYSIESPYRKVYASEIKLSSTQYLAKFKLLGVCGRVQIVFDSITCQKFALKLVHKFSDVPATGQYVFPKDIPHMMQPVQIQASQRTFYLFFNYLNVFALSDAIRVAGGQAKAERDHELNAQLELLNRTQSNRNKTSKAKSNQELNSAKQSDLDDDFGVNGLIRKARRLLLDVEQTMRISRVEQERREEKCARIQNQQLLTQMLQIACSDRTNHLKSNHKVRLLFNESLVRQWLQQLVEALHCLHRLNVLYIRLCPDKILLSNDLQEASLAYVWTLDKQHLLRPLSPLSLAMASGSERSNHRCMPYLAPEILTSTDEPGPEADWWSLGLVAYELLTNRHPSMFLNNVYNNELDLEFSDSISSEAQDFVRKLLQIDPNERLGRGGLEELVTHPFLSSM